MGTCPLKPSRASSTKFGKTNIYIVKGVALDLQNQACLPRLCRGDFLFEETLDGCEVRQP